MKVLDKIIVKENKQRATLRTLKQSQKPILVYGAGVYAYVVIKYLRALRLNVSLVAVDSVYKTDDHLLDLDILAIEDMVSDLPDFHVVIGTTNYPSAIGRLKKLNVDDPIVIDVPDFLNIPAPFMSYEFIKSHESYFQDAYDLLEDELSRQTFTAAINTKINEDPAYIKPMVRLDHLYFTETEFPIGRDEILLDVGGYTGDSIKDFLKSTNGRFRHIISLEPFPRTYTELLSTIHALGITDKCTAIQSGAWSRPETLPFNVTENEIDNKIATSQNQEYSIVVQRIDDILTQLQMDVTFIKMDINGAEYHALQGAASTIRKCQPRLAIKMHVKEDFYRLPLMLKDIAPNIKLFLRQRNYMSMMLVLYGIFEL